MNRKLFASVALAAAIGLGASTANAGSISAPAVATSYAAEALTAATVVTMPTITYTMGVARAAGANFTVLFDFPVADTLSCAPAPTLTSSQANYTVSLKRCGGVGTGGTGIAPLAYDVVVTAAGGIVGDTFTITNGAAGMKFTPQNLNVAGNSVTLVVAIKDPGETSQIDNAASLSKVIATSLNAVNVFGPAKDVATVVDVNNGAGPLFGFVANATPPPDTITTAAAFLTLSNNSTSAVLPDGITVYDFKVGGGTAVVTVTDTSAFSGLAASPAFCLDLDLTGPGTCNTAAEIGVVAAASATFTIPAASFGVGPAPLTQPTATSFKASGTTSLGTGRSFSVAGTITPTVGSAHGLADPAAANGNFWTWGANATVLQSPWMSTFTASGYTNRFFLMNTAGAAVGWTATCLVEAGNTSTAGTTSGTIPAGGIATIPASSVCTFSGASRGAVIFVINAPAAAIKGTFQQVTPQAQVTDKPLERVYLLGTF